MSRTVKIPVPRGIQAHEGMITEIVLREPSFDDYLELGEISTYAKAPDGTLFIVENGELLKLYIARCLVVPKDVLLLSQGGFGLARDVRTAILSFFRGGASEGEPLKTSPTTSSSDSTPVDLTPGPSA